MTHNPAKLLVVVSNDRYDCFGDTTTTLRFLKTAYLFKLLKAQGGVSDSVEEGRYHFYLKRIGFNILVVLEPAE